MKHEDKGVTALDLPMVDPLPEDIQAYFDICDEKLGMVPNVLKAYAFDMEKLRAFSAMYNDLMRGDSGLSKLEREVRAHIEAEDSAARAARVEQTRMHVRAIRQIMLHISDEGSFDMDATLDGLMQ